MMIAERMRAPDPQGTGHRAALRLLFPASDHAVRAALQQWRRAMICAGMCIDLTGRAEIVLAEVLNNITEHGSVDGAVGWIGLRCDLNPSGLRVIVTDRGRPLPPELLTLARALQPVPSDLDPADLPEGGFGWHMIRLLSRDLHCTSEAGGNRLSFLVPRLAS